MATNEILTYILESEGLSVQDFSSSIGYPVGKLYDIKQGRTKRFSDDLVDIISEKYPKYTRTFLLTGEMAKQDVPKEQELRIDASSLYTFSRNIDKILSELTAQREMSDRHMTEAFEIIRNFQSQTDRMITLLEKEHGRHDQ